MKNMKAFLPPYYLVFIEFCWLIFILFSNLGNLIARHRDIFHKNPLFVGMRLPSVNEVESLRNRFPRLDPKALELVKVINWRSFASLERIYKIFTPFLHYFTQMYYNCYHSNSYTFFLNLINDSNASALILEKDRLAHYCYATHCF